MTNKRVWFDAELKLWENIMPYSHYHFYTSTPSGKALRWDQISRYKLSYINWVLEYLYKAFCLASRLHKTGRFSSFDTRQLVVYSLKVLILPTIMKLTAAYSMSRPAL